MAPLDRYGSSEYSAEAEALFAEYVRRRAAGEALDFDAFSAEHEDQADELDGLHADWDNVGPLLERMGVLERLEAPPDEAPATRASSAGEPSPGPPRGAAGLAPGASPAAPLDSAGPRRPRAPRVLGALLILAVVGTGALAWKTSREVRAGRDLAARNQQLSGEVVALAGRADSLDAARAESDRRAEQEAERSRELQQRVAAERLRAEAESEGAAAARREAERLSRERDLARRRERAARLEAAAVRLAAGDAGAARATLDSLTPDVVARAAAPLGLGAAAGELVVALPPEGRTLACIDAGGLVRLWRIEPDLPAPDAPPPAQN